MKNTVDSPPFRDSRVDLRVRRFVVMSAVCLALLTPAVAHAAPAEDASTLERSNWVSMLWGSPQRSTMYAGMWTRHLHHGGVDNNRLGAITYRGYFAGTFINSYHRRSYAVGIERSVRTGVLGSGTEYGVGYRVGAIHGYDSRLLPVAGKIPVVPFAQAVGDVSWKRLGVEGTFCVRVVTAGLFVRF